MSRRRTVQKRSRSGGNRVIDRRAQLLKSDIDLGFTFVAVALTSYTAGNTDQARQAARDAQKKLRGAQKQVADIEMGQDERRRATDRLKNLEQVLITIEAKDPGVFAARPVSTAPRGRKNGDGP